MWRVREDEPVDQNPLPAARKARSTVNLLEDAERGNPNGNEIFERWIV